MELVLESFVNDALWIFAAWLYHIHLALLSLFLGFLRCKLLFLDLQLLTHYKQMLRNVFIPLDVLWFCIDLRLECWLFENNRLSTFTGFPLFSLISFQCVLFLLLKLLKDFFRSSGNRRVECTLSFSILLNDNLFEIFMTSFLVMNLVLHKLTQTSHLQWVWRFWHAESFFICFFLLSFCLSLWLRFHHSSFFEKSPPLSFNLIELLLFL